MKVRGKAGVKVKEDVLLGLSETQIIVFLLEFLAVSAIFLVVWFYIGEFYQGAIFFFAKSILLAMGYTPVQVSAINLSKAYLAHFNLVPLVALAIATPKLPLRKRIEMLVVGVPLLFILHVFAIVVHFPMHSGSELASLIAIYSLSVGTVAAPFIIWLALLFRNHVITS